MKIISIIMKNLKVLFRHRISLFILLLGPLIIIMVLGFLFGNQSVININIGYTIDDGNNINQQYVDNLKQIGYKMIKYDSEDICIDNIKSGLNHVCIFFKESQNTTATQIVEINVDTSQKNIVYLIENLLVSAFELQTEKIQLNNTRVILDVINETESLSHESQQIHGELKTLVTVLEDNHNKLNDFTQKLETTYDLDYLRIDELQSSLVDLDDSINEFSMEIDIILDELEISLDDLSSSLDSVNFTSAQDEEEVYEKIEEIESNIEEMRNNIDSFQNQGNTDSLGLLIANMVDILYRIDQDINEIISNLIEISFDINKVEETLDEDLSTLEIFNSQIIKSIDMIELRDAKQIINPVELEIKSVIADQENELNSSFPAIISTLIFIVSILLASNFILAEKTSIAYFRNFLSRTRSTEFFLGNFATLFLIIFIQMALLLFFYYIILQKSVQSELFAIILAIIPFIAVFVLLGMAIGYISKNQTMNITISFTVIAILIAFSGFIMPVEALSGNLVALFLFNPYLISISVLRKLVIFDTGLMSMFKDFAIIFIYITILILTGIILESANSRKSVLRYYYLFFEKSKKYLQHKIRFKKQ